jgi:hypothetical protein
METQNFDIGQRKQEGLKLEGFSRYDFELESIFKFPLVFKVCFLMQYESDVMQHVGPIRPHQKKNGAKYRWRTYSW